MTPDKRVRRMAALLLSRGNLIDVHRTIEDMDLSAAKWDAHMPPTGQERDVWTRALKAAEHYLQEIGK